MRSFCGRTLIQSAPSDILSIFQLSSPYRCLLVDDVLRLHARCENVINDHHMVLSMSLYSWDEVPEEWLKDDISRKIITGKRVMAALIFL